MGELKDGILLVVVWVALVMALCWFFVEAI